MAQVLTNAGKAINAGRMIGSTPSQAEPKRVGWGTGAGVAAAADAALFTEAAEARVSGTSSLQTTAVANDTYQLVATIVAAAGRAITNAGNFDASAAGNLHMHADFAVVNLNAGDSITFTFKEQKQ